MDPQSAQPEQNPPAKTGSRKTWLIAAVALTIFVTVVGLAWYFFTTQNKKEASVKVVTGLSRDSITIGIATNAYQVFPASQNDTASTAFNSHIFDGLGKISEGEIKPDLAVSWTNPDKNTWRFHLRKGVKFTNGDPFTATDVKFSIDSALEKQWPDAFNLSTVSSVEIVDDFTVDVKTSVPDPVLFNRLAYVAIVSAKQFENIGSEAAVGTGPYKFVSGDEKEIILEANANYFLGAPKIKKVIYKFYPDGTDEDLVQKMNQGEVDLASITDPTLASSARKNLQVKDLGDPFITFLWLDVSSEQSASVDKTPNPLQNKLVREAMYKVVNPSVVIKAASRSAQPASQYVTNSIFGFNPAIIRPSTNVEEAKKLMDQVSLSDGFNMTLIVYERIEQEGKALAAELAKIKINTTIKVLSDDEFFEKLGNGELDNFILDYGAETFDSGEIFTDVLHTPTGNFGINNLNGYSNPEIDKLADDIATTFDPNTRKAKLQSAMAKAVSELPLIPLYSRAQFHLISKDYDWTPTAFGNIYADEISGRKLIQD